MTKDTCCQTKLMQQRYNQLKNQKDNHQMSTQMNVMKRTKTRRDARKCGRQFRCGNRPGKELDNVWGMKYGMFSREEQKISNVHADECYEMYEKLEEMSEGITNGSKFYYRRE